MKKYLLVISAFAVSFFIIFSGCKKLEAPSVVNIDNNNNNDLSTKITTSVSGFVTTEANAPVSGAAVTAGNGTATTDQYGYFEIKNTALVKNAAVVSIYKPGYFNVVKTFIASTSQPGFFRVILLAKTTAGTINAGSGGTITLSNGMAVTFPAGAFVNAATGAAYTGTVNVALKWLDPSAPDLVQRMPGDLRGKTSGDSLKLLTTYGMSATELTGSAGELLQIAPGKKATLSFPIPASLQSTAPPTIPLWFFDEATGLWKQEGTAARSGTNYVGDVSHFSFWNCDVPNNYIQFDVTINDAGANPVQDAIVKITNLANGDTRYGYTNSNGFVSGAVPPNTQFLLQVLANYSCSFILHSQNFSTATANTSLGVINLLSNRTIRLYGNITNCNSLHVTSGRINVYHDNLFSLAITDTAGNYTLVFPVCTGSAVTVNATAIDLGANTIGNSVTQTYQGGTNNILNLQACANIITSNEFLNYTLGNGNMRNYLSPPDSVKINQGVIGFPTNNYYQLNAGQPGTSIATRIQFTSNILIGQTVPIVDFADGQVNSQGTTTGANITVTEFGPISSGYIAGSISGTVSLSGGGTTTVSGSFRARRPY